MITVAVGPGAVIRAGCADRGGGGQGKHRMGLGDSGPDTRGGLAVSLAEQPVRLSGKFLGTAVMLWSGHCCSTSLVAWLADSPAGAAAWRLAELLIRSGDLDGAVQLLRAAADAGDRDAALQLAGLLAERGDLDGAGRRVPV